MIVLCKYGSHAENRVVFNIKLDITLSTQNFDRVYQFKIYVFQNSKHRTEELCACLLYTGRVAMKRLYAYIEGMVGLPFPPLHNNQRLQFDCLGKIWDFDFLLLAVSKLIYC